VPRAGTTSRRARHLHARASTRGCADAPPRSPRRACGSPPDRGVDRSRLPLGVQAHRPCYHGLFACASFIGGMQASQCRRRRLTTGSSHTAHGAGARRSASGRRAPQALFIYGRFSCRLRGVSRSGDGVEQGDSPIDHRSRIRAGARVPHPHSWKALLAWPVQLQIFVDRSDVTVGADSLDHRRPAIEVIRGVRRRPLGGSDYDHRHGLL
jgi:hypothetical protein